MDDLPYRGPLLATGRYLTPVELASRVGCHRRALDHLDFPVTWTRQGRLYQREDVEPYVVAMKEAIGGWMRRKRLHAPGPWQTAPLQGRVLRAALQGVSGPSG